MGETSGAAAAFGDVVATERSVERLMTNQVEDPSPRIPSQRAVRDESHARRSVELELRLEFPSMPADQLTILVECLWSHFDDAPVREYVPVLVRKQAKEELLDHLGPRQRS